MNKILFTCCALFLTIFPVQSQNDEDISPESQLVAEKQVASASALEWSPDGNFIAVGTDTGIEIYDEVLVAVQHLPLNAFEIFTVHWSPDGKHLAIYPNDNKLNTQLGVYVWNINSGEIVNIYNKGTGSPSDEFRWLDAQYIVSANFDDVLEVWGALNKAYPIVKTVKVPFYQWIDLLS